VAESYLNQYYLLLNMANVQQGRKSGKRCFVTIGATAPFNSLIQAVLQHDFISALHDAGYSELRIQYGNQEGESIFQSRVKELDMASDGHKLEITGFGFNKYGLRDEISAVKGLTGEDQGTIISHAGEWATGLQYPDLRS
jgi:beta-1,4-N-acetylglucosaminyltransferase